MAQGQVSPNCSSVCSAIENEAISTSRGLERGQSMKWLFGRRGTWPREVVGWLNRNMVLTEACSCEFKVLLINMVMHFSPIILDCRQGVCRRLDWPALGFYQGLR